MQNRTGRGARARRGDARKSRALTQGEPQVELEGEFERASLTWARLVEEAENRIRSDRSDRLGPDWLKKPGAGLDRDGSTRPDRWEPKGRWKDIL